MYIGRDAHRKISIKVSYCVALLFSLAVITSTYGRKQKNERALHKSVSKKTAFPWDFWIRTNDPKSLGKRCLKTKHSLCTDKILLCEFSFSVARACAERREDARDVPKRISHERAPANILLSLRPRRTQENLYVP